MITLHINTQRNKSTNIQSQAWILLINLAMEKPAIAKSKIKFLMLLPKAAAAAAKLPSHPFSPGKVNANKLKSHQNKGFSGPITSVVLEEARNKSKNSTFDAKEPTSPKISCMGQIKHKKKISSKKKNAASMSLPKEVIYNPYSSFHAYSRNKPSAMEQKKKKSASGNIFNRGKPGRKSDASYERSKKLPDRAPSLSHMKRFASGRDSFASFDWTSVQVAPEEPDNRRCYSDEEKRDSSEEEQEDEVIIPFSAPILLGEVGAAVLPLEPRKEINLWKRRTMAQPKPLQLNTW